MAAATIGWKGHGPYLSLVGGIDDATGLVPWAIHEQEDAQGSFELLRAVVRRHGIPLAVYSLHRLGELMFDPETCPVQPTRSGRRAVACAHV
jgi:hypothetical protein